LLEASKHRKRNGRLRHCFIDAWQVALEVAYWTFIIDSQMKDRPSDWLSDTVGAVVGALERFSVKGWGQPSGASEPRLHCWPSESGTPPVTMGEKKPRAFPSGLKSHVSNDRIADSAGAGVLLRGDANDMVGRRSDEEHTHQPSFHLGPVSAMCRVRLLPASSNPVFHPPTGVRPLDWSQVIKHDGYG